LGTFLFIQAAGPGSTPIFHCFPFSHFPNNIPSMRLRIRSATPQDVDAITGILGEAARWLEDAGMRMWRDDELAAARIAGDVSGGSFFLAECDGVPAGTIKFQLEDPLFWPDLPQGEAAYIHRLAVRRCFAGKGISTALMQWAVERAGALGRRYVRLDCEASRPRLRAVYERFGFRHHSDRQVGPYFVARYEYAVRANR
jgi:GNAT superfamily N-acetyltransferase